MYNMFGNKIFNVNDRVFAKIRGHPAWPAIVTGVSSKNPTSLKYNLYFYGTGEYAECKPQQLTSYKTHKSKFGKPKKNKLFMKALQQIEYDMETSVVSDNESCVLTTSSNRNTESSLIKNLKTNDPISDNEVLSIVDLKSNVDKISEEIDKKSKKSSKEIKANIHSPLKSKKTKKKSKLLNKTKKNKSKTSLVSKRTKITDDKPIDNGEVFISTGITNNMNQASCVDEIEENNFSTLLKKKRKKSLKKKSSNKKVSKHNLDQHNFSPKSSKKNHHPDTTSIVPMSNNFIDFNDVKYSDKSPIVLLERLSDNILGRGTISLSENYNMKTIDTNFGNNGQINKYNDKPLYPLIEPIHEFSLDNQTAKTMPQNNDIAQYYSLENNSKDNYISRFGRKRKPTKYLHAENTEEIQTRSIKKKRNSKGLTNCKIQYNETVKSLESNNDAKDKSSNSEVKNIPIFKEMKPTVNENSEDSKIPIVKQLVPTVSNEEMKPDIDLINKTTQYKLLKIELKLLDYIHNLHLALQINYVDFNKTLKLLEQINQLKVNAQMLIKHQHVVDTIHKVTEYIGNKKILDLSKQEAIKYTSETYQIRYKAQTVFNKFKSLFTIPDGQTFLEVYYKKHKNFLIKTNNLPMAKIYGSTSDITFD